MELGHTNVNLLLFTVRMKCRLNTLLMPILALIIGVISLFTDPKNNKNRWLIILLICSLISASVLEIFFKAENQRKADAELSWSKERIGDLIHIVNSFRSETKENLLNLASLLKYYGWENERLEVINLVDAEESFMAEEERELIKSKGNNEKRGTITVQYFPKDVDKRIVNDALKELGFNLITGTTKVQNVPTNSIWFGSSVLSEDLKLVAYTLIRAGIKIKAIRPFRNPTGVKAKLIQVGADALLINSKALTVNEIRSTSTFERKE